MNGDGALLVARGEGDGKKPNQRDFEQAHRGNVENTKRATRIAAVAVCGLACPL